MSGGVEKSSATMSCLCPPDCCSPEVEKDDGYVWFLIKVLFLKLFILAIFSPHLLSTLLIISFFFTTIFQVLYGQWIVMGSLALPIIARQLRNHHIPELEASSDAIQIFE